MKIALCQINPTVGAINQNKTNILDSYNRALDSKADIVVFPELALIGYPPQDLLLRDRFIKNANNALEDIMKWACYYSNTPQRDIFKHVNNVSRRDTFVKHSNGRS